MSRRTATPGAGRAPATLVLAALLLAGCGVPTGGAPQPITAPGTGPGATTSPSPRQSRTTGPEANQPLIYFVTPGNLVAPTRQRIRTGTTATVLADALAALSGGPNADQRAQGLGTAIPPGLVLTLSVLSGGTATIDLSGDVPGPSGQRTTLAVAQIVLTATSVPGVSRVLLTRKGSVLQAPLVGGVLTSDPLTAQDYQPLVRP